MDIEQTIDRVVEQARDTDIDAITDADYKPLPFELKPDIFGLAVALADLRQTYDLPELVGFNRGYGKRATIHVDADWFNAEFAGNPFVTEEPNAKAGGVKKTIIYEDVEIYCWQNAEFRMVAV